MRDPQLEHLVYYSPLACDVKLRLVFAKQLAQPLLY